MRYGIRWEHICDADLEDIYGDLETADAAISALEWELARDPIRYTWPLPKSDTIRLAHVGPFVSFPAVWLSFCIIEQGNDRYCLMLRARPANVAGQS